MSRLGCLLLAVCAACAGPQSSSKDPQTAREKQLQEARAKGELDAPRGQWGGWRYQGDRDDCFYVVGRRCFKSRKLACRAAHCAADRCAIIGGGPASVQCKKPKS